MLHFKPFLEDNWKCVHQQDLPWNQSQYPCTFQIYWNYHFCLCVHCQNSPKLHWTSEEHLWPCKYWNHANHFRFKFDILWNLISIYLVTYSALLWSWVTRKRTRQHFLSQTCETFVLSWLGFPKTSHHFLKTSECCRKCPKTDVLMTSSTSEAFERHNFSIVENSYDTKSAVSAFLEYFCGNCFNWIFVINHVLKNNN